MFVIIWNASVNVSWSLVSFDTKPKGLRLNCSNHILLSTNASTFHSPHFQNAKAFTPCLHGGLNQGISISRFMVDNIPIRRFLRVKNLGVTYPLKPMSVYATIWHASSWATGG